jgi:hypothetical protein
MAKSIFQFGRKKKPAENPPSPEPPTPVPVVTTEPPPPVAAPPETPRARTIPSEELFKILGNDLTPWMNTDKTFKGLPHRLAVAYGKKHRDAHGHEIVFDSYGAHCTTCKFQVLY